MRVAVCRVGDGARVAGLDRIGELDAWWVRLGDEVLLYSPNSKWRGVSKDAERRGLQLQEHPHEISKGDMYLVVQKGRLFQQEHPDIPVMMDKGRYLVVEISRDRAKRIAAREEPCYVVQPLRDNSVVFETRGRTAARSAPVPCIQDLVNGITAADLKGTLSHLVTYFTRHSTSNDYTDAAAWCEDQLKAMGYEAGIESISVGGGRSFNVIAEKPGSGSGDRGLALVVAHLDSVNSAGGPGARAPGADDNGSGSAGVLEIARVLKDRLFVNDLRLILFGGEEQGLNGSKQYVKDLPQTEKARIRAVINMDMIGSVNTTSPTVLLEGAPLSQSIMDDLIDSAGTYTDLVTQTSLNPFASDHVPFLKAGVPAVLTIEGADSANSNIHSANDTLEHVDRHLAQEILRMNVAFIATVLRQQGGGTMTERFDREAREIVSGGELAGSVARSDEVRPQFSGRYKFNGGAEESDGLTDSDGGRGVTYAAMANPIHNLNEPIYAADPTARDDTLNPLRFTIRVDIDGINPLHVVSGTVAKGAPSVGGALPHFIGRVTSNTVSGGTRSIVVEDFKLPWPGSSDTISKLEIDLTGSGFGSPAADVTFIALATENRYGPYSVQRESIFFRDVEMEIDREDGAVDVEPYDTRTHPDRPADLPHDVLTFEKAFAASGVRVTRSSHGNVVITSEAGSDKRWSDRELHDAMEKHWSAFANKPQWKMWIFLAELATSDSLGGIMFDGRINEPGGVDRQGTAVFTKCHFFHSVDGAYIQENPPKVEAVKRELFFNLIHETGHAFNLAHSFQKQLVVRPGDTAWSPPAWMPLASDDRALSWMNYPDRPSPGLNASWFYNRFRFRFDDNENLFLRHAPANFVEMGNEDWFVNHGRVARESLDRRLELKVRSRKAVYEVGEPVIFELRLGNNSNRPVMVHENLDPSDGQVEMAITTPNGERRPFISLMQTRVRLKEKILQPNEALYHAVNLTVGRFGFPFKTPGPYRIEAGFRNLDGGTAASIMQLWVRPPANFDDMRVAGELYTARVGRVLSVGGSRVMDDVNERLKWVCDGLGERHPATYYLTAARAEPLADKFKVLEPGSEKVTVLDPDPEEVEKELAPVVENSEAAADAVGHITYRRIADTYTKCALEVRKKTGAMNAQKSMLGIFEKRNVIQSVVDEISKRIKSLK
jgi:Peptidase family M28